MALITTVGGIDSNSYVTITEANLYFANHWSTAKDTAWSELSIPQRERILIAAAQMIESLRFIDSDTAAAPFQWR
jgi:hypothetical protein